MPLDEITLTLGAGSQAGLAVILGFIMFSVALGLSAADFRRVARRPGVVVYGVVLQIIALPALTWLVARALAPAPSVALGMMVVAACPGGSMSNLLTVTARGDAALSVSLTAVSSVLATVTTPLNIVLWASLHPDTSALIRTIGLDRGAFLLQTALLLAVPLAAGMLVSARAPTLARKLHKPCHRLSLAALGLFIVAAVAGHRAHLPAFAVVILPVVIAHNALAIGLGHLGARVAGLPAIARRAFAFEIGIQNAGLGLVLVLGHFPGLGGAALVTAGWGIWHLISGLLLAGLWARRPAPHPAVTKEEP